MISDHTTEYSANNSITMISKKASLIFYSLATVCLVVYIILLIQNDHSWGGWLLLTFFISLAIAFRSNQFLRGLSYTLMILAVVSFAMYHPQYFKTAGVLNYQH